MTHDELKKILADHEEWIESDFKRGRQAELARQDLRGANLRGANLSYANLSYANLSDAYLSYANLSDANLSDAYLGGANLIGAYLSDAYLSDANLRELLAVPDLDKNILAAIEAGGKLNMESWHTCETTHCRAGWAIHLAGEKGTLLEALYGSSAAGALIYAASRPDKPIPDFHASNDIAMASIKADAASGKAVT
jgi:uncharacterized protein YjbI with pentapeptide repeats